MRKLVKTLFQNDTLVSVRDYEVAECIRKNDVMHICFQDKVMTMDPHSLKEKVVLTSGHIPGRNGTKGYCLVSYKWDPNIEYDD